MVEGKKSNSVVVVAHGQDGTITFSCVGAGSRVFDPAKVNAANRTRAELHGWEQRIRDAAALPRDTLTGKSATPGEKFAEMVRLIDHYESGSDTWSVARSGFDVTGITYVAIARLRGIDAEAAKVQVVTLAARKFEGDVKKALAYLRTDPKVGLEIVRIKQEQISASNVEAGSILEEME